MYNFQFLAAEQAKSTSVCCGTSLVSLQEWGGGEHKEKFSDRSVARLCILLLVSVCLILKENELHPYIRNQCGHFFQKLSNCCHTLLPPLPN